MEDYLFKPIEVADRSQVSGYTLSGASQICDFAFANLYGWGERYGTSWAIVEGGLVIRFRPAGREYPAYLMPLCDNGESFARTINKLANRAEQDQYPLVLMGVTERCRGWLETHCPSRFEFISDEGSRDYVYLRERLVSLSGKSLQSKRNHINKFEKLYPNYSYEPITTDNITECLEVETAWLADHEHSKDQLDEQQMIRRCLSNFEALRLMGGALRVDGKIIAFTFGSPINQDTFGVHVEKANTAYDGAYPMINREFARHIPKQYTYINREEDLGIEGLRKSKLSYKPELILHKDVAVQKK